MDQQTPQSQEPLTSPSKTHPSRLLSLPPELLLQICTHTLALPSTPLTLEIWGWMPTKPNKPTSLHLRQALPLTKICRKLHTLTHALLLSSTCNEILLECWILRHMDDQEEIGLNRTHWIRSTDLDAVVPKLEEFVAARMRDGVLRREEGPWVEGVGAVTVSLGYFMVEWGRMWRDLEVGWIVECVRRVKGIMVGEKGVARLGTRKVMIKVTAHWGKLTGKGHDETMDFVFALGGVGGAGDIQEARGNVRKRVDEAREVVKAHPRSTPTATIWNELASCERIMGEIADAIEKSGL